MKVANYKIFLFILSLFIGTSISAQSIYNKKFEGCLVDRFETENNTIKVKQDAHDIVYILANHLSFENVKKIRGTMNLQILVDKNGSSCLLSIKNKTNIDTEKLNIKEIIDQQLTWQKPKEKTSVLVSLKFYKNGIEKKRIGMNPDEGLHEIKM